MVVLISDIAQNGFEFVLEQYCSVVQSPSTLRPSKNQTATLVRAMRVFVWWWLVFPKLLSEEGTDVR